MKNESIISELACKLTTPQLRERKEKVINEIKQKVIIREQLLDGLSFTFKYEDSMMDQINNFIKSERQCCPFFSFLINITDDNFIKLTITGPIGSKEFIINELNF